MNNNEIEFIKALKIVFPTANELHFIYDGQYNVLDKNYNILYQINQNQITSLEKKDYFIVDLLKGAYNEV